MPEFHTSRRVAHSAAHMFELVADVERYPEFVPLCHALRVIRRAEQNGHEVVTATMTVAYKMLHESFTSRIELDRAACEIRVSYLDGPFRRLENVWAFTPLGETACEVNFRIAYEFRSRLLASLMGVAFDKAFRKFATAFEARADEIYGRENRTTDTHPAETPLRGLPPAEAS